MVDAVSSCLDFLCAIRFSTNESGESRPVCLVVRMSGPSNGKEMTTHVPKRELEQSNNRRNDHLSSWHTVTSVFPLQPRQAFPFVRPNWVRQFVFVFSAVHHSLELFLRNWLLYKLCNYRCVSQEHTVRSQRVQCLHLEIFLRSPNMNLYSKLEAEDSFGGVQKLSFDLRQRKND